MTIEDQSASWFLAECLLQSVIIGSSRRMEKFEELAVTFGSEDDDRLVRLTLLPFSSSATSSSVVRRRFLSRYIARSRGIVR